MKVVEMNLSMTSSGGLWPLEILRKHIKYERDCLTWWNVSRQWKARCSNKNVKGSLSCFINFITYLEVRSHQWTLWTCPPSPLSFVDTTSSISFFCWDYLLFCWWPQNALKKKSLFERFIVFGRIKQINPAFPRSGFRSRHYHWSLVFLEFSLQWTTLFLAWRLRYFQSVIN